MKITIIVQAVLQRLLGQSPIKIIITIRDPDNFQEFTKMDWSISR